MAKQLNVTKSFRLPIEINAAVTKYCDDADIKPSLFFNEAVIEKLTKSTGEETLEEVKNMSKELLEMRMELAILSKTLLRVTTSNYELTDDNIKEWLTDNLKHHSHVINF